ncbi:MAG TPA: LuxR C-terminal-related transcriptional regulator, partial [Thermomicrobiales bacterium]|nr:LuxR C-terminal-related transcriptional regulator [Thermomicrobiales bacterium]
TLVLHRTGDLVCPAAGGRYLADRIPGARYVELPGADHLPFAGDQDAILDEIEFFLTGARPAPVSDRALTTLLVIELATAAETAVRLGDRRWGEIRQIFRTVMHEEIGRHGGREVSPTLDGALAAFDVPARAVRCAESIIDRARRLGVSAHAGLHTGEVAVVGDDIAGVAVHLAARIAALAGPGEIFVSNTVEDLVTDADLAFEAVGEQALAGLPGSWRLHRLVVGTATADRPTPLRPLVTPDALRPTAGLSRREREVAALLTLGLSNRQIADELAISVATTARHVANILTKLGFNSRAQVAAWAVDQGLM